MDSSLLSGQTVVVFEDLIQDGITLLSHENERGTAAEEVLAVITDTQNLPVDAVTGATCSSLVLQKAVENALTGGISHE